MTASLIFENISVMSKKFSEKGFAPLLLIAAIALLGVLTITKVSNDNPDKSVLGVLVADNGGDSGSGDNSGGGSSGGSGDSGSGGSGSSGGPQTFAPPPPLGQPGHGGSGEFHPLPPNVRLQPNQVFRVSSETENEGPEASGSGHGPNPEHLTQQIEQEIEHSTAKFIKFGVKDGGLDIQGEDASGSSKPNPFGATVTHEATAGGQLITITVTTPNGVKTIVIRTHEGRLQLESHGLAANANLPISLDNQTHELTVTTPNGTKTLTVLPDEAANIATSSGIQNQVDNVSLNQGTNNPVFTVDGFKSGRLFGLFNVSTPIQTQIDATTGQIINTEQSFLSRLLSPFIR